jgi:hypothetical protein
MGVERQETCCPSLLAQTVRLLEIAVGLIGLNGEEVRDTALGVVPET